MKLSNKANYKSILIIRLSSMGDLALTTAYVRWLKKSLPEARIDFCLNENFAEVFEFSPYIDNLWKYSRSFDSSELNDFKAKIKSSLENGKYDLVIDLQKNRRSKAIRVGLGNSYAYIEKLRLNKLKLVYFKKPFEKWKNLSIAEHYADTFPPMERDYLGLEIRFPEEKTLGQYPPLAKKKGSEKPLIAIAPAAAHFTKRWLKEYFAEAMTEINKKIDCSFVLLGGPGDRALCEEIIALAGTKAENEAGKSSIIETLRLLDKADVILTNDTGVMHLASARKVPVVVIFGSSVRELGFAPYGVEHIILENSSLTCRPCSHIGRSKCPKKHFKCMKDVRPGEAVGAVLKLLGSRVLGLGSEKNV